MHSCSVPHEVRIQPTPEPTPAPKGGEDTNRSRHIAELHKCCRASEPGHSVPMTNVTHAGGIALRVRLVRELSEALKLRSSARQQPPQAREGRSRLELDSTQHVGVCPQPHPDRRAGRRFPLSKLLPSRENPAPTLDSPINSGPFVVIGCTKPGELIAGLCGNAVYLCDDSLITLLSKIDCCSVVRTPRISARSWVLS